MPNGTTLWYIQGRCVWTSLTTSGPLRIIARLKSQLRFEKRNGLWGHRVKSLELDVVVGTSWICRLAFCPFSHRVSIKESKSDQLPTTTSARKSRKLQNTTKQNTRKMRAAGSWLLLVLHDLAFRAEKRSRQKVARAITRSHCTAGTVRWGGCRHLRLWDVTLGALVWMPSPSIQVSVSLRAALTTVLS